MISAKIGDLFVTTAQSLIMHRGLFSRAMIPTVEDKLHGLATTLPIILIKKR